MYEFIKNDIVLITKDAHNKTSNFKNKIGIFKWTSTGRFAAISINDKNIWFSFDEFVLASKITRVLYEF